MNYNERLLFFQDTFSTYHVTKYYQYERLLIKSMV